MIIRDVVINGTEFRVALTDQTMRQVGDLKNLYAMSCEDPESFDQISSQISGIISSIAATAEPAVTDGDLDGFIQEVIKMVDSRTAAVDELTAGTGRAKTKKRAAKTRRSRM